jgi:hypothetical protein
MIGPRSRQGLVAAALRPVMAVGLALLVLGCASAQGRASAPQPPAVPGEDTQGPDLTGVQLPDFQMPLIRGRVSRPKRTLTPGAVTTSDANVICNMSPHTRAQAMPFAVQTAVYAAYGYTTPAAQHKYILDYLVPYDLGGVAVQANIWPAAVRGTGFYEKMQTDHILRQLVCRRSLTPAQAQHVLETDWYSGWLRYVVGAGHI